TAPKPDVEATAPPGAFALRATAASPQAVATGAVRRPGAMLPGIPVAPPPTAPGESADPRALVPRAPLVPPQGGVPDVPLAAVQSEAVPTMADGGALKEHAKRLESLPEVATDPAALEYFAALRARSGQKPSDPPPVQAAFAPKNVAAPRPFEEKEKPP